MSPACSVVVVVVVVLLAGVTKGQTLQQAQQAFPVVSTTATYPRNLTDVYKGSWQVMNGTSVAEGGGGLQRLSFSKMLGKFVFQVLNQKTELQGIDTVTGDLVLRNGIYSTDSNRRFLLQGVYWWRTGILFLVANPADNPVVEDYVIDLDKNSSLWDSLQAADNMALERLLVNATSSSEGGEQPECFFTMLFQLAPVAEGFNERYSYLYEKKYMLKRPTEERPILEMNGTFSSRICQIEMEVDAASIQFDVYYSKAVNYVVMVALSTFVQIIFLIRQIEHSSTQSAASKVSLLAVGMQTIMDSYLCLVHLTGGIVVESVFNAFATAAFFQFVLFSVFEMRFLLLIWKSRLPQGSNDWSSIRRELGVLYARFYFFLMLGFFMVYYLGFLINFFVFLMFSFFVPQIYCNAARDSNNSLTKQYMASGFIRLLVPLYFYGCPYNFIHAEPNTTFAYFLFSWMLLQVIFLSLQDTIGPRFFIPKQFLPVKYDYSRPIVHPAEDWDCVICMNPITPSQRNYMITPCDHVFHEECLVRWLQFKMECPTCRRALPNV